MIRDPLEKIIRRPCSENSPSHMWSFQDLQAKLRSSDVIKKKSPNTQWAQDSSFLCGYGIIITGIQLSVCDVPGSWRWCGLQDLCTRRCQIFPLGRLCLLQQISVSQRTCLQSWTPNPPSSHRLRICPHSHSRIWTKQQLILITKLEVLRFCHQIFWHSFFWTSYLEQGPKNSQYI